MNNSSSVALQYFAYSEISLPTPPINIHVPYALRQQYMSGRDSVNLLELENNDPQRRTSFLADGPHFESPMLRFGNRATGVWVKMNS
ncbi:hypothetical protein PG996_003372 [Apiospora saccharicola]|uniref:Uncharacterized protein n=1 Tax=Apiospora saccharicola TaxID=335842 RepID=A0ABR1W150_9PEZI